MSKSKFAFEKLVRLLGRSENDPEVKAFFGKQMLNIERDEYYGSLEFRHEGVDVAFQEAPWVVRSEKIADPKELYIAAFHLHRDGHEGFAGYSNPLPNGLALGDSEAEALHKMGQPIRTGGGGASSVTNGSVPRWFWFPLGNAILHIQLDVNACVEMVTPQTPNINLGRTS